MSGLRIFQNREFGAVRVIEYGGEPWFVARDVCAVLGTETRDLPDILEHDEQRPIVDIIHTLNDSTGLRRDSRIISEPGLYSLVLRSRNPPARQSCNSNADGYYPVKIFMKYNRTRNHPAFSGQTYEQSRQGRPRTRDARQDARKIRCYRHRQALLDPAQGNQPA